MNLNSKPAKKKNTEPVALAEIMAPVARDLKQVEIYLLKWADGTSPVMKKMVQAAFRNPGKLIRPGILLLTAAHLSYKGQKKIAAAAAIEAIHTASLIHDDIIDGSPFRRGKKTLAVAYGEKFGLLLGDFFFIKSIATSVTGISPVITEHLVRVTEKMIEGEAEELARMFDFNLEEEMYWRIIELKTASLFEATCLIAAELAGCPKTEKKALSEYGKNLGLAFQVVDDLIDITSSPKETGKPGFSDLREGRLTLPFILARDLADPRVKIRLKNLVQAKKHNRASLNELIALLENTGALKLTIKKAEKLIDKSKKSIMNLKDSPYRRSLIDMADFVLMRRY